MLFARPGDGGGVVDRGRSSESLESFIVLWDDTETDAAVADAVADTLESRPESEFNSARSTTCEEREEEDDDDDEWRFDDFLPVDTD